METTGDLARFITKSNPKWINSKRVNAKSDVIDMLVANEDKGIYFVDFRVGEDEIPNIQDVKGNRIEDDLEDLEIFTKCVPSRRMIKAYGRTKTLELLLAFT